MYRGIGVAAALFMLLTACEDATRADFNAVFDDNDAATNDCMFGYFVDNFGPDSVDSLVASWRRTEDLRNSDDDRIRARGNFLGDHMDRIVEAGRACA